MKQSSLFEQEPHYCIDTNVLISFMRKTGDEYYGSDIFAPQWQFLQELIEIGVIVAPLQVEVELLKWKDIIPEMSMWVKKNKRMFVDVDTDEQLASAKKIIDKYGIYATTPNYLGDLAVMTLADAMGLSVISLEAQAKDSSDKRPKIPNVCQEFGIKCMTFVGFLRNEKYGSIPNEDLTRTLAENVRPPLPQVVASMEENH